MGADWSMLLEGPTCTVQRFKFVEFGRETGPGKPLSTWLMMPLGLLHRSQSLACAWFDIFSADCRPGAGSSQEAAVPVSCAITTLGLGRVWFRGR